MNEVMCSDPSGVQRAFEWEHHEPSMVGEGHRFLVRTVPPQPDGQFFEARLDPIDGEGRAVRLVFIGHPARHPAYRGMGIPQVVIPLAAAHLGVTVRSSPPPHPDANVRPADRYRTRQATAMWVRLVAAGLAAHDPATDTFVCPPAAALAVQTREAVTPTTS